MSSKSKKTVYADSVVYNKSELSSSAGWREWSDSELNSEAWDYPKNGEFVDPQELPMPSSLKPRDFKRFPKLNNVVSPLVFETTSGYPDLIVNNKHLLHSEFMRSFVSTLINIQYCGRDGLKIENSSTNFSWNFVEQRWQGWYHVYSLNKAGKGVAHQPVINPNGKYIVRIFFMGRWRRVLIDDTIPVDKRGRPLLPRTANVNELWPMILAKAMLKVAAISWTSDREIVDCSFVTCLTGWIGLSLNVSHLSPRDQWEFLTKYAKNFEWCQDDKTLTESANSGLSEKGSKKQSQKSKSTAKKKLQVPEEPQPTLLFLNLEDMRDVDAEEIPGITPCWNHQIYVELSRNVPLHPAQVKPPLAKWKQHRWLDWAIRRGIIDASEYFVPIRYLLIVSPLKQFNDDTVYSYDESEEDEDSSLTSLGSTKKLLDKSKSAATTILPKGKSREVELPEISLWSDFNKLSLYLREVHLFYRQKFFKYSIEVSDNTHPNISQDGKRSKTDQASMRDGKKSAPKSVISGPPILPKTYEYDDKISQSRNEALYLFVDSVDEKLFLVNLSTMALDTLLEDSKTSSSLIIERHDFFRETIDDQSIAEILTRGTKSTVLQLEAGRHLLRIFISSESSYNVSILSDTPFQIGDRSKMHELMTNESERIKLVAERISDGAKKAFESFGNSSYSNDLRVHYKSYMPVSENTLGNSNKKALKSVHRYFREEFSKILDKRFSIEEKKMIERSLRIFFLDPSIGMNSSICHEGIKSPKMIEDDEYRRNKAATLIQSFFRMFVVKHYKAIHEPSHGEHNRVKEALRKVVELFESEKDESVAQTLLRSTVKRDKIFETLYPFASDFKHVIRVQQLKGRVPNVSTDQWIPIVRVVVNSSPNENVFSSINLFADLANYNLRVFANDTKREMFRVVNNVAPNRYKYRKDGYTVLACGWNDSPGYRDIEWILNFATIKGEPMFNWMENEEPIPESTEIRPLIVREISNTYVPNIRNCIAKISLKIAKRSLVSLRLRTSYEKTLTRLRVVDETGGILSEVEGSNTSMLPMIFLEFRNSHQQDSIQASEEVEDKSRRSKRSLTRRSGGSSSHRSSNVIKRPSSEQSEKLENWTRYYVEAYLREDSWPLTEAEWAIVAEAKTGRLVSSVKPRKSSIGPRISKIDRPKSKQLSKKSLEVSDLLLPPYWILQIVSDASNELEISQDRSREEKIDELRKIWKIEESDRSARGRRLREKFLEDNSLIVAPSVIDVTNVETTSGEGERKIVGSVDSFVNEILLVPERTQKPPADLGNYLPKLDLTVYMERDDEEEDSWVKSEYDEETLRNQRAMNILDFEHSRANFLDEFTEQIDHRRRTYRRFGQRYLENCANRARAIEDAYEVRQAYIDSTKSTARSVKSKSSKQKKAT